MCLAVTGCSSNSSSSSGPYLLVLGDSLSTGYQNGSLGDPACAHPTIDATGHGGWACLVLAKLKTKNKTVQVHNLAINSEDTCAYFTARTCDGKRLGPSTPQATAASDFLKAHAGDVRLITLDIGADDAASLATKAANGSTDVLFTLPDVITRTEKNYDRILAALHKDAPNTSILVLGYYVPTIPAVISAQLRAQFESVLQGVATQYNTYIAGEAKKYRVTYVDLFTPFAGKNATLLHPNDIHPSNAGQRLISQLVWRAYGR